MYFDKVSVEQWNKDIPSELKDKAMDFYVALEIPKQGSKYSAGMDFFAPFDFTIPANGEITIPTGICWITGEFEKVFFLSIYPRSGLGFKHGICLANTVGIIDADYYMSDNEGHIMIKLVNPSNKDVEVEQGKGFAQGVITEFFTCKNARTNKTRNGGFGSTDEK